MLGGCLGFLPSTESTTKKAHQWLVSPSLKHDEAIRTETMYGSLRVPTLTMENQQNLGRYTIHGCYEIRIRLFFSFFSIPITYNSNSKL